MTDPDFHITTPRLYLSHLQPSLPAHCAFLVALYNSPAFIASVGGTPTSITTPAAARTLLAGRFRADHARNGYGTYLVSLRPAFPSISKIPRHSRASLNHLIHSNGIESNPAPAARRAGRG